MSWDQVKKAMSNVDYKDLLNEQISGLDQETNLSPLERKLLDDKRQQEIQQKARQESQSDSGWFPKFRR